MDNKQQIITDIFSSLLIMLVLYTVFLINHDLGNGIVSGKYFWFYASMALLTFFTIPITIVKRKERFDFVLPDLLLLLFCCAAVGITFCQTGRFTTKCLLLVFLLFFYFYLRIFFSYKSKRIRYLLVMFFIFTGLLETIWGLRQLYGFIGSQHTLFKITGSFFNPGPYSGWLAMVFPMALWYAIIGFIKKTPTEKLNFRKINIRHIFVFIKVILPTWIKVMISFITALCILSVLPAAMSRASWLAALGGSAFIGIIYGVQNKSFLNYFKKNRKKILALSFATIILSGISMTGLFMLKKDSALGRVFTWKIAVQTIKEHPMGVGLDNFAGSYGNVQAKYFALGSGTEQEEYVASDVEYAFNEYLQICIETGIIPFLVFLTFIGYTLFLGIKNNNYLPAGSLVSLLIFASMSYPFNILPFVIAFVFLSALCVTGNTEKQQVKNFYSKCAVWTFIFIIPIVTTLSMYKIYPSYDAYKQWKYTEILYDMDMHKEAAKEFDKQYVYLQDEVRFLFEYAYNLSMTEEYKKSNEILKSAMHINCDPMLYNIMAKNYQSLHQYELAEQCLKKAVNLVPNRLYPHYRLAKLYFEMGLPEKAQSEADIVLTKKSKVESKAIEEMREEMRELKTKNL
jgi:tetratricopeptide (TPR) repeat protein